MSKERKLFVKSLIKLLINEFTTTFVCEGAKYITQELNNIYQKQKKEKEKKEETNDSTKSRTEAQSK